MKAMKKRVAIVILLLMNCCFVAAQSNQPKVSAQTAKAKTNEESPAQRAEAILKLAREAKGGEEKLKQVSDLTYSGDYITYDASGIRKQRLTMFLYRAQKVRTDVEDHSSGFDGKTAWFNDKTQDERAKVLVAHHLLEETALGDCSREVLIGFADVMKQGGRPQMG